MVRRPSNPKPEAPQLVVTATARLAREMRREHDARQIAAGRTVWPSPEILPIRHWLTRCFREWLYSGPSDDVGRLLGPFQERVIWEDIVRRSPGAGLLNVAATAEAAMEAWNLVCAWRLPLDAPEWRDTADTEAFHAWTMEFLGRLESDGSLSSAQLPAFLAARVREREVAAPERVVFTGFVERTPAENVLLDALEGAGAAVEERTRRESDADGQGPSGVRLTLPDRKAEVRAAAAWACRRLEEAAAPDREARIGVIVPDLEARRGEIERAFSEMLHPDARLRPERDPERLFNISLGPALRDYPIVDAAFTVLALDPGRNPLEATGRLLRSRFLGGAQAEATRRALLDGRLRRRRAPEVDVIRLIREAGREGRPDHCPLLGPRLEAWRRVRGELSGHRMPSDWAGALSRLLEAMGWPGDGPLSSADYQTLGAWGELLSEFSTLDAASGPVPVERALDLIERSARARQFQPESGAAPIQVLGLFEASGLDFDHAWLMGAHDEALPGAPAPVPFIPTRLGRRFDLPRSSPARDLEFARALTVGIVRGAASIVVSRPARDDEGDLRWSPLFAGLPEVSARDLDAVPGPTYPDAVFRSSRMETIEDHEAPPWTVSDGERARRGAAVFRLQAACPFRAFAELRLGAEGWDAADPGLSPLDRGVLVHDALERVWRELRSHAGLVGTRPARVDALVAGAVGASIRDLSRDRSWLRRPRFAALETDRLSRVIRDWLVLESRRQPFTVVEQERSREVEVGGVRLTIRADRVDRVADGGDVILDYKTGDPSPAKWEGDRPDDPQLPLYAATAEARVAGVFFGVLKAGRIGFRGIAATDGLMPGTSHGRESTPLAKRILEWAAVLDRLGREFTAGVARVDPKRGLRTCTHCHLAALCRVHESFAGVEPHGGMEPGRD